MPKNTTLDPSAPPVDPKELGPKPPFPEQKQEVPGTEALMTPKADHGQESYRGSGKLTDRVAVITGGDSGIGRAVAIAFAREGADVVISYLNEHEDAKESERLVKEAGRRAITIPGDISDEAHCRQIIDRAFQEFGKLDILVNNAAYQQTHQSVEEWSSEEWDHTFRVNIYAMFYLCKAAVPRMKPGATIINVASIQAFDPSPNLLAYSTTKGAIVTFSKSLAAQSMEKGIRVNVVAPGPVWTPLIPSTMPPEKVKEFGKQSAFQRPAQPAELAPAFVFLASERDSSFVTASVVDVTGGQIIA